MYDLFKNAVTCCKTLLRNGYDAHVINAPLQARLLTAGHCADASIDIACEADLPTLTKLFPTIEATPDRRTLGILTENGMKFRFYALEVEDSAHPELGLLRITPHMISCMPPEKRTQLRLTGFGVPKETDDVYDGFEDLQRVVSPRLSGLPGPDERTDTKEGSIRLTGIPDETLRHNYLLAVRALRFASNFDLPVEPNTWLAIIRSASRVLDYVPVRDIMDEWRKVSAENLWKFVRLLHDAHILQGLIPEVAALACIQQEREDTGEMESVFDHTLECMRRYPEEDFHYDWLGTMAMLFHDVGKLYTGEYFNGHYTFYQHHRVGAKVTRKILRRLHFLAEDIDLLCHLVRYHMRFHFMLTDRGIRRFKALEEYPRLMEMARADIKARNGSYTYFNHNKKYLDRAETSELMLEPLLNGNQIMEVASLPPGPMVGVIRDALLQAQIAGEVTDKDSAIRFVQNYKHKTVA